MRCHKPKINWVVATKRCLFWRDANQKDLEACYVIRACMRVCACVLARARVCLILEESFTVKKNRININFGHF